LSSTWSFDFYYSLGFWGALGVAALLFRLAGGRSRLRSLVLLAASSAMLLALPRFGPRDLLLVWLVAGGTFAAARLLCRAPGGRTPRRRWLALGAVLAVLAVLCFFKYQPVQALLVGGVDLAEAGPGGHGGLLVLIGVSYFTAKAIHVVVEAYKGTLTAVDGLTFLNYMTFFPAFISGPIQRYPDFAGQLESGRPDPLRADLAAGFERIVRGLFKKLVLVPIVYPYVLAGPGQDLAALTPAQVVVGLYAYAVYFYLDFSAYSDLAIGGARLVGLTLPENFADPFLQRNIRDLWSGWHMSLTTWLIDYVYWPVVRQLRNLEFFRPRPVLLSIVGMNVTFLACGVWHGEAAHFILWGAYHGLGISIVNVYQRQKRRLRSAPLQRWFQSRASRVVGMVGTFNFFAAGLGLFVLDLDQLRTVLAALFG
jgi:alginate O-acetyltransferase complex protein AlgI